MPTAVQIVFEDRGQVRLSQRTLPDTLAETEVLIRTESSLISPGTELAVLRGTHTGFSVPNHSIAHFPHLPGYSAVGRVEAVGAGVRDLAPGNRVVAWAGHASHLIIDTARTAYALVPEQLPAEQATLASLGAVALHGVRCARVSLGDSVVVLGLGLVGLLAAQLAQVAGTRPVLMADVAAERRAVAEALGIGMVLDAGDKGFVRAALAALRTPGARAVLDSTGSPRAIATALLLAARGGRVVLLGSPHGRVELDLYSDVHARGVSMIGAHGSTMPAMALPGNPWTLTANVRLIVDLLADGTLRADLLISQRSSYLDAPKIYEQLSSNPTGQLGIVLGWDQ